MTVKIALNVPEEHSYAALGSYLPEFSLTRSKAGSDRTLLKHNPCCIVLPVADPDRGSEIGPPSKKKAPRKDKTPLTALKEIPHV